MKSVFRRKMVANTEIVKNHENRVQVLLPALNGANLNPLYFFKKVFAVVVKFAKRE